MLQKPALCDNGQLPFICATRGNTLPNDIVSVIRSIVPPPPDETFYNISKRVPGCFSESSQLFQRRPTEKNLLQRGDNGSSFSAKDTEVYLEDIFIQLVQPNKYTDGNKILDVVLESMLRWKLDIAVQEQAFKCLVCLSQQCADLQPPPPTVPSVLKAMECFHRFELIQRMGVNILKCKTFLDRIESKIQLAHLIFRALCNLPEMEDFMLHAKEIVQELSSSERDELRTCSQYVEMLLDFPNRKNDKITVFLSWCALETLILLAESDKRWKVFINVNGEDKVWRMSCRPELEDRCQALLKIILSLDKKYGLNEINKVALKLKSVEPVQSVQKSSSTTKGHFVRDSGLACKVQNDDISPLPDRTSSDFLPEGNASKYPVDDAIRLKPPTPPQTLPVKDARLSDDASPSSYLYTITSPSYSPPPETYALLERRFGVSSSPPQQMYGDTDNTKSSNIGERGVSCITDENVPKKSTTENVSQSKTQPKLAARPIQCLFCFEPKARRPLLVKQYNNLSHCLLQPGNTMLYKLLQSYLCELHKM